MPDYFKSPEGDLEKIFVDDYAMIDQYAKTGSLWVAGDSHGGVLTVPSPLDKSSPIQITTGGTDWKFVSSGDQMIAAIKTDGTLWVWGQNDYGQLGTGNTTWYSSPVQTSSAGTNWKQVSCGGGSVSTYKSFTYAIKNDGTLWTWGGNNSGQLGLGDIVDRSNPVQNTVLGTERWKSIALSTTRGNHAAAIRLEGTLFLWGDNGSGQLGTDNTTPYSSPVQTIAGGTNWKQVACGRNHTAAIKTDGTLWAWGRNSEGQLGNSTTVYYSSPIQIGSLTNWKQVACGQNHTAAIKTDGTLWTWGLNSSGQLGDNTSSRRSSPVQTISAGTNWKQVSCGYDFTSAIKTDGTLWNWGLNILGGNLGVNDSTSRSSPVQTVAGGTNWKQVASGDAHNAYIYFYDAGNLYPNA